MNPDEFKRKMWSLIHSVKMNFFRLIEPAIRKAGLTPLQAFILYSVKWSNMTNVGSICRDLNINQGNVSTMCKKLEKAGLVSRNRISEDERVVSVTLTGRGYDILADIDSELSLHGKKLDAVPDEKLNIIISGFEELNDLLKSL
jgi:DNA-binding MarR family transcriptional regulator